jgi:two-component system sensor histidine kinase/response regulator
MRNRSVSIAVVLSVALVTVITLLLAVFAGAFYASEKEQRASQLKHALGVSADQQAAALALPVWNLDAPHVVAILRSGMRHREIQAIAASTDGKTYVQGRDASWQVVTAEREPPPEGLLVEERAIEHRGEALGKVRVYATPKFLDEELAARRSSIIVFILVLDATLVASLYLLLWQTLLKPVKAVQRFAASVQEGRRVDEEHDDCWFFGEIESLRRSISDMTAMLDSRYQALRQSEERLKLATKASAIGIWDWDVLKNELVWDEQMYRLYGIRKEDFGGAYEAWGSALDPAVFRQAHEDVEAALAGEREFSSEFVVKRPSDGAVRIIKGEAMTIRDESGRVCRMVGVNFDITERKRVEEEIRQLNIALEQRVRERTAQLEAAIAELGHARDQAESATRAKSEFLANMSHEIRTPMNAILGMTDLALRSEMTDKQRSYLTKAKAAADSLLIIINDILDFSKIEAGKLDMEVREFQLQGVLDRVTAVVGLKAQEKGLELLLNTASDVPPALVGDSLRLEQVLINLCANAVKFTAHGEIVVVTVKSLVTDDERVTLRFSVRDTGVGMNAQQIEGLFQPFNQVDASTTRQHGGTGLGLAICKKLVGLMGGEIGVKSQPGKGSDFHFTAVFGLTAAPVPALPEAAPSLRNLRILVIDDSANARDIFQNLLRDLGYHPVVASSAAGGLAELGRAGTADKPYDLVLVDWKMPEMDGFEVADHIRLSRDGVSVPKIIMVTAYGDEALVRRAVAEKLDGCLSKPVSASALLEAIMSAFGPQAEEQARAAAAEAQGHGAPPSLRGRHVLLVEDNEFNQIVATELLGDVAGMIVTVAVNGQEAVDRIRAERFDAVLMDVQMPVMDGYQATALIRHDSAHSELPIIAMTAHAMARDRDKCLAVGMNDYVTKPFEPAELFAVLAKWIVAEQPEEDAAARARHRRGVSFELGLQRCMGRVELYEKILGRFLATRLDDARDIRDALAAHDLDRAASIAHSIISTAGTIGAEALSDAARALQLAIDAGEAERLPALVETFAQRHAVVAEELHSYFARRSASRPSGVDAHGQGMH